MDFVVFTQQVINGLVNGMAYVLIATGLTLIFGVLRIVNFAHGEFYMLGAFFTYYVMSMLGLDYISAALIATGLTAAVGILANVLFFWPLRKEHEFTILLSSLGLALLLTNGGEVVFGADPKYVASPFSDEIVEWGDLIVTQQRLVVFAVGVVVLIALYLFIKNSSMGKMMRATAQNAEGAALTGINIRRVHAWTFALACGLAAVAGALVGPTAMIYPTVGSWAVLKGFIVVIMGGLGSIPGALVGGLALGVIESLGGGYISLGFAEAIGYAIIIIVLLWRPQGLFGTAKKA
ncbi:branched-chain amino acid transport system permease protein [Rhodoligotrophos appendicifer]|uniref:branched-chain amino acid ABC transporter permease n=1 Tax=Rhodoligotrophos appendicifer TaxID=987056 RepID=UPI001185A6E5|nr:branched-chain amino acid ABC transporter permease [Rhodoligotrophos appendicifer]